MGRDKRGASTHDRSMELSSTLSWLVDAATDSAGADRFLAELGANLLGDGLPLAGGALTLDIPHPLIARRTWLWRADNREVIEALGFAPGVTAATPEANPANRAGRRWLATIAAGAAHEDAIGPRRDGPMLSWIGPRPFTPSEIDKLHQAAGFTALSDNNPPAVVIAALNAWFDRIAGAVHAFGGEVLKFIGDGILTIFPVVGGTSRGACEAALRAVSATRVGMAHLDEQRLRQGLPTLPFGAALHLGEILWGNIGAADRLDFTAIGPAVNLVSRLEGLCKPLRKTVLVSGALAAETEIPLIALGTHALRGIASPCVVFTLPEN